MQATISTVQPVYALVGQDRFLLSEELKKILRAMADELDELGPTRVDGSRGQLAEVLDEVRTRSLLGSRRVVIVEDADPFITANRKALERYCESPSADGCLVLLCKSLPKNTRLHRIINNTGMVVTCEPPKGRAVLSWLTGRAQKAYGKRLGAAAAQRLREHLGDVLGLLDAELGKLAAYTGGRDEIAPADIDALTGHHREEKVFAVTDAMSSGDTAAALGHWEQVLATDRAAPGRAIAGLAWGVRRLLQARRDWEEGTALGELARRMYTDPAVLKRRLQRVTVRGLEAQQHDLLEADLAIKTGASTLEVAVERFIVKHSTKSAAQIG